MPGRNPDELTTDEGYRLLDEIRAFGDPLMVFTGGDPLKRPDLFDLIRHSVGLGLRTNVTPSATPLLTASAIDKFKRCGVTRMAISVDGPDAETHDSFRGVPGTFDRAMFALGHARDIALDTQFQTTVTRRNMNKLAQIAERVSEARLKMWSLFFLVVTGRAMADDDLTAEEYEKVFEFMYDISKIAPFDLKTTEAMHYRRYVAQRQKAEHGPAPETANARGMVWRTAGVSDGKGFVFVSHTGEIFPSGFLRYRRATSDRFAGARLPRLEPVPDFARHRRPGREVRRLRIPEDLRRLPLPRLRVQRQLPGRRSTLHIPADNGGRYSIILRVAEFLRAGYQFHVHARSGRLVCRVSRWLGRIRKLQKR